VQKLLKFSVLGLLTVFICKITILKDNNYPTK